MNQWEKDLLEVNSQREKLTLSEYACFSNMAIRSRMNLSDEEHRPSF